MKIHRFIGDYNLTAKKIEISDPDLTNQLSRVLRLQKGDQLVLCDGQGKEALVSIEEINRKRVSVTVLERMSPDNEPIRHVVLYCSILKRENFEMVVQKATEIGIAEIYPLISSRTIKTNIRYERLERIIKEAAEQSGRCVLPVLHDPIKLDKAIELAKKNKVNYFFHLDGDKLGSAAMDVFEKMGIFIGPEGGWQSDEVEKAKDARMQVVSLGGLTLRAETAAIVGSFMALHNFVGM